MNAINGQPQSTGVTQPKAPIGRPTAMAAQPASALNEGIGEVHGLCLALRDRLDNLMCRMKNSPSPEAAPTESVSTMQEQLVAAIQALGEANAHLDGIVGIIGYQV